VQTKWNELPSVSVRATKNSEKGGRWSLAFKVAKTADKITYGATILNICGNPFKLPVCEAMFEEPTNNVAIKNGLKIGTRR
jgi:hypothetical protein